MIASGGSVGKGHGGDRDNHNGKNEKNEGELIKKESGDTNICQEIGVYRGIGVKRL